jgi:hypothetical protein
MKSPKHRADNVDMRTMAFLTIFIIALFSPVVRRAYPQKINFIKDLSIKSDENDELKSFLMVEGVDADSRGNIYALAAREYKIQVYSPKGEYLRTIGKKGQGPGELEMPFYILLDKDDNLYVFDYTKSAFVVFSPEGKYIRNISTKGQYREIPDRIVFDSRGNFIIGSDRIRENSFKISRYDKDFNQGEDLYVKTGLVSWLQKGGGVTIQAPRYTPGVVWAMDDKENIFVCYNKTYDIEVYSPEKKLIRTVTRKFTPEKVPEEEIEQIVKQSRGMLAERDIPRFKPPVRRLFVVDGYLFVQKWVKSDKAIFDVFDEYRNYEEEISLDFLPRICKNGYVYTVKASQDFSECEVIRFRTNFK